MKTKYIFFFLIISITGIAKGQLIPHGISYQGTARDVSGEIISKETISLRISLENASMDVVYFSEVQRLTTSSTGQFKMIIGGGSTLIGSFYQIPWSAEAIWLEIQIKKDGASEFTTLSKSEMLAVPYAFHAGTADKVTGNYVPYSIPGTASTSANSTLAGPTSWLTHGNSGSTPPVDFIGTSDIKDLVIKTNGIERMKIFSNGNINITNTLTIGNDLTVNRDATVYRNIFVKKYAVIDSNMTILRNVNLNTSLGSTINYGPFTVGNISPSILKGTLRVDKPTTLNNGLNVNNQKPTLLTGSLRVNNATDLYNSFTVNVQAPSVMTGTLRVDSNVTFKNRAILTNTNINSTNTSNGNLIVSGGVGIRRNLFVGGDAKVSGKATLNGQVKITDPRISERQDSGALVVTGGVGIGKELKVRGAVHLYDSLRINKTAYINDALIVTDSVTINATFANSALVVNNKTTFNHYLKVNNQMTINVPSLSTANGTTAANYPLRVQGGKQGIAIRVSGNREKANNFVSFWDNSAMQGRIEGFTNSEYLGSSAYIDKHDQLAGTRNLNALLFSVAVVKSLIAANKLAGALSSSTGCFGLGACVTVPIPSLIASGIANFAAAAVFLATSESALLSSQDALDDFESTSASLTGITYESGAGDYAEYLEMVNPEEAINPGDIVGMKNGKISRTTAGADKLMVVSVNPIVLGNTPSAGKEKSFKKVAFIGQVPVKVIGKVNEGDYILADGNNLGMGVAKKPSMITASDIKNIVGIAWESSTDNLTLSTITVAVGLNVNDNNKHIETLQASVNSLHTRINERNRKLARLLPNYKSEIEKPSFEMLVNDPSEIKNTKSSENVIYFGITREQVEAGLMMAEKQLSENGIALDKQPGFENFKNNTVTKEKMVDQILSHMKELQSRNKSIDQESKTK